MAVRRPVAAAPRARGTQRSRGSIAGRTRAEGRTTGPRHRMTSRAAGSPALALARKALPTPEDCRHRAGPRPLLGAARAAGEAWTLNCVLPWPSSLLLLPILPNSSAFLNPRQALLLRGIRSGFTLTCAKPYIQRSHNDLLKPPSSGKLRLTCKQLLWSGHSGLTTLDPESQKMKDLCWKPLRPLTIHGPVSVGHHFPGSRLPSSHLG